MAGIEKQTTVNAPAVKVFEYVSDISRHPEWAAHKLEVEKASEGPVAAGSTFACEGHQMGTHRGRVTVTELVPNQKVVYESQDNTGLFRHWFTLREENGTTRLTKGMEALKPSGLFRILAPLVAALAVPRALDGDLKRIKAKIGG